VGILQHALSRSATGAVDNAVTSAVLHRHLDVLSHFCDSPPSGNKSGFIAS
jgi:hypothetical protein